VAALADVLLPAFLMAQGQPPTPPHDSAHMRMPMGAAAADSSSPPDSAMRSMQRMGHGDARHPSTARTDTAMSAMPGMTMLAGPLGIPMTRQGSGTSWLPDAAPMHAQHFTLGGWGLMVHGVEFFQFDRQVGGSRGDSQFGGLGWLMGMATHALGAGRVMFRGMFSADPWTVTERGYPEILQSGESFDGAPLHDRQHPHDLFMELAGIYETPVTHGVGLQLYAAPAGEPAVGPVAFPHRPSASSDPFAPLSHHWQDATHIAFGVLTADVFTKTVKLEGSIFNGREPDQHRGDLDFTEHSPVLDSYSGRLTVNPSAPWSISTWYAYLRSPEQLEPTVSQHRMGASVLNERPLGSRGHLSSAFIYSANLYSHDSRLSNSVLLETNADLDGANTVFGRIEYVNKAPADLAVTVPAPPASDRFNIGSLAIGYVREIGAFTKYGSAGLGVQLNRDIIPAALEPAYRTRTPGGFGIFLRLRPAGHVGSTSTQMEGDAGMHGAPPVP
jgi:hypothetical protein